MKKISKYGMAVVDDIENPTDGIIFKNRNNVAFVTQLLAVSEGLKPLFYEEVDDVEQVKTMHRIAKIVLKGQAKMVARKADEGYVILIGKPYLVDFLEYLSLAFGDITLGVAENEVYIKGLLAEIPRCCIAHCIQNDYNLIKTTKSYLSKLDGKKDPFKLKINKNKKRIVKHHLYHIPCSPECEHSKKISETYGKLEELAWERYGVDKETFERLDRGC